MTVEPAPVSSVNDSSLLNQNSEFLLLVIITEPTIYKVIKNFDYNGFSVGASFIRFR